MMRPTDIKPKVRETVKARDGHCCVYCGTSYSLQIAHVFVNRSHGGLGIEENLVVLCIEHHMTLDNGRKEKSDEVRKVVESYLEARYPGTDLHNLKYRKGES